jgi:prepilin-type N-terminal cleavage/methylation domain-containing protein
LDQTHSKQNLGFTLIEMMITVLISTSLLLALMRLYLSTTQQTQLSIDIQERALQNQLAIRLLQESFHNAGFFGCLGNRDHFTALMINPDNNALPFSIRKNKVPDSDVIKLQQLGANTVMLSQPISAGKPLPETVTKRLPSHDRWIIGCQHAERVDSHHPLQNDYDTGTLIGNVVSIYWYVRQTRRLHLDGSPLTALARQEDSDASEDIVEDIRSMEVRVLDKTVQMTLWMSQQQSRELRFALANLG